MSRLIARRLLVVALMCVKAALGSAMPLPMLIPTVAQAPIAPAAQCSGHNDLSMPGMVMPETSCTATPARPEAPCCKTGACAVLQAPPLALAMPSVATRVLIAPQPPPVPLHVTSAPLSKFFRPPI